MIKVQKAETELARAREAVTSWEKALEAAILLAGTGPIKLLLDSSEAV